MQLAAPAGIMSNTNYAESSSASAIFVIPLGPPSLKPWLGVCIGWLSAVVLFSPPPAILPATEGLEFVAEFGFGLRFGFDECSSGT